MDGHGEIICLTYLGGERVVLNYNVMGVAKASLESSVKYLAHDLGKRNIRVNAISAGPIKTLAAKGIGEFNKLLNGFLEKAPMERLIDHEDLGNTALYLLSDLSSGVTGETIHVDCGYSILGY
jgi:enoyl-[acyl-carrier protein] reductase I